MLKLMKGLALALALACTPVLASCASLATLSGRQELSTADEKALLTAELAFDATLNVLAAADAAGAITPQRAAVILPQLQRAREALVRARALYDANQTVEAGLATNDAVSAVQALATALVDLGLLTRS